MRHKNIIALFSLGTVLCTLAAAFQLFDMTDYATGFFKIEAGKSGWMVTLFIGVVIACVGLVSAQSRRVPKHKNCFSLPFFIISCITGIAGIYEVFANDFARTLPVAVSVLFMFLGLLSAVSLVLMSAIKSDIKGIFAFAPLAYALLRLIIPFSRYTKMPATAQNVYELTFFCFQLLFWLYAAMTVNSVNSKRAINLLFPTALMTACVCATVSLPQLAAGIIKPEAVHKGTAEAVFLLCFGVYAAFFVFDLYSLKRMRSGSRKVISETDKANTEFYTGDKK